MIIDNPCKCGHERSEHAEVRIDLGDVSAHNAQQKISEGVAQANAASPDNYACMHCDCKRYVRSREYPYLVLARFAELVERGAERLKVERIAPPGDGRPGGWRLETTSRSDLDITAKPGATDDGYVEAERFATRWMVRMQDSKAIERPLPPRACPTCNVPGGRWCQPMHDGERDAGNWVHPARSAPEERESEVVRWAQRVKRGEQLEVWPGLKATANLSQSKDWEVTRKAVDEVVDEILRLVYINEALLAPYRKPEEADAIRRREKVNNANANARIEFDVAVGTPMPAIGDEVELVDDYTVRRAQHRGYGRVTATNIDGRSVQVQPFAQPRFNPPAATSIPGPGRRSPR